MLLPTIYFYQSYTIENFNCFLYSNVGELARSVFKVIN